MKASRSNELELEITAMLNEQSRIARISDSRLVRLLLGTAPYLGGIQSVIGQHIQQRQEIRLRRFLVKLAEQLEEQKAATEERIDYDYILSEEFSVVVENILREAATSADEQKLDMLRQFLISAAMKVRPDVTWQDLFIKYIRQLSGTHLIILVAVYGVQGRLAPKELMSGVEIEGCVPLSVRDIYDAVHVGDPRLAAVSCSDLGNAGLLLDWRHIREGYQGFQERYCLTESGLLFVRFLQGEWGTVRIG
jgi:hypothetical protein